MKNTFRAAVSALLEFQTRRLLKRKPFKIVAVSGAVGKTTTKLAIATVLSQKYRVLVQKGSYNDEIGLPLACFGLTNPSHIFNPLTWLGRLIQMERILRRPSQYDLLVIEVGTDSPGEIPHTLKFLQPDIGVVTAVAPEHMAFFTGLDQVAAEELALISGSKRAVMGWEDVPAKYRHKYVEKHPDFHYYGIGANVEYGCEVVSSNPITGTTATFSRHTHKTLSSLPLLVFGVDACKAATAAFAVADLMGLTHSQINKGLQKIVPVQGRMNPLRGINDSTIIDDTYNSSPSSLASSLNALYETPTTGRKIALLGSMNELGADARQYHEEAGTAASGVDLLVTFGGLANSSLGPAAVIAGLDPTRYKPADTALAAGEYLKLILRPGDIVLAKGSQNRVFTEEAVKMLLNNPEDQSQLVRQSPFWLSIKARQSHDES